MIESGYQHGSVLSLLVGGNYPHIQAWMIKKHRQCNIWIACPCDSQNSPTEPFDGNRCRDSSDGAFRMCDKKRGVVRELQVMLLKISKNIADGEKCGDRNRANCQFSPIIASLTLPALASAVRAKWRRPLTNNRREARRHPQAVGQSTRGSAKRSSD